MIYGEIFVYSIYLLFFVWEFLCVCSVLTNTFCDRVKLLKLVLYKYVTS